MAAIIAAHLRMRKKKGELPVAERFFLIGNREEDGRL
jgi:hypothetical protein